MCWPSTVDLALKFAETGECWQDILPLGEVPAASPPHICSTICFSDNLKEQLLISFSCADSSTHPLPSAASPAPQEVKYRQRFSQTNLQMPSTKASSAGWQHHLSMILK